MIVNPEILEDLYGSTTMERKQRALKYVEQKRVNIKKVTYEDSKNFDIRSTVRGNGDIYDVHITVNKRRNRNTKL